MVIKWQTNEHGTFRGVVIRNGKEVNSCTTMTSNDCLPGSRNEVGKLEPNYFE